MTATDTLPRKSTYGHVVRPEIQGLRALAVSVVVIYHVWPQVIPGGYVGVDVFFVISGFLITAHISRGILDTPKFSLTSFYARRLRRLLPASLLVLLVSSLATLLWLPETMWNSVGRQLLASVFYVQNWVLAADSVDYLAADTAGSPLQHFWSLAVEEQFYLVWPLLLVVAALVTARGRSRPSTLIAVVSSVTLVSFVFAVVATNASPADAYFITPTRVWEFGVGALCSFVVVRALPSPQVRAVISWAGIGAIAASALLFTSDTPFPGTAALLPVLGTAAVIVAGNTLVSWSPGIVLNRRPVQFLGGISYSLYLWHWPIIVFFPFAVFGEARMITVVQGIAILAASVLLAILSKRYVEDPFRGSGVSRSRLTTLLSRHRAVFTAAVIGMVVVASVAAIPFVVSESRIHAAQAVAADGDQNCFGAAAMDPTFAAACATAVYEGPIAPDPLAVSHVHQEGCQQRAQKVEVITCSLGSTDADDPLVVVAGDSHANQWLAALDQIATSEGWQIRTFFKSGCSFNAAPMRADDCEEWNDNVAEEIDLLDPELLFTSAVAGVGPVDGIGTGRFVNATHGFEDAWSPLLDHGTTIVAIADIPRPAGAGLADPPTCVLEGRSSCTFDRSSALIDDAIVTAGDGLAGVSVVDLTDSFCAEDTCESVIGNVLVYADGNHMTSLYSETLAPEISRQLEEFGVSGAAVLASH